MFDELPEGSSRYSPTGPKISLRTRASATGPKIPLPSGGGQSKISRSTGILMITVAAVIDFSQFILTLIPFVGWILSPLVSFCTWLLFGIWFHHLGVSLFDTNRILGTVGAMIGEAAPFINAFPWWTARVFVAITSEWRRKGAV